jgi:hypothetical protein
MRIDLDAYERFSSGDAWRTSTEERAIIFAALQETGDFALHEVIAVMTGVGGDYPKDKALGLKEEEPVKILKRGAPPLPRTLVVKCLWCKPETEFEVTTADVRTYGSEGGYGDSSTRSDAVQCPVCKGQIPVPNPLNWNQAKRRRTTPGGRAQTRASGTSGLAVARSRRASATRMSSRARRRRAAGGS